jgi:hypothetical protein
LALDLNKAEGQHEYQEEQRGNYVQQLEAQLQEGGVELQSNKAELSAVQEEASALKQDNERLSLEVYRGERRYADLDEHQGNYVLDLEVRVDEGDAELQSNKTQLSTMQTQLNISQQKVLSAERMQTRLNELYPPVRDELVRLMTLKTVSLGDCNCDSLKKLRWVPDAEVGELLRDFFTHRDFDSRKTLKKLVCLVWFVVHVRIVVLVPSKRVYNGAASSPRVFCTSRGRN